MEHRNSDVKSRYCKAAVDALGAYIQGQPDLVNSPSAISRFCKWMLGYPKDEEVADLSPEDKEDQQQALLDMEVPLYWREWYEDEHGQTVSVIYHPEHY